MQKKTSELIPANKNGQYQIKENEKGFYHLRVVEEIPTKDERRPIVDERTIILSVDGFKGFLAHKAIFNYKSEEIIHDPTYAPPVPENDLEGQATPEANRPGRKPINKIQNLQK
jgi:hypothetical protein